MAAAVAWYRTCRSGTGQLQRERAAQLSCRREGVTAFDMLEEEGSCSE
jgi:hypothetical protein